MHLKTIDIIQSDIPLFPAFKKLELQDRNFVSNFNSHFLPYSDFNFMSLWSYDVEEDVIISFLNNNLVIQMRDYITNTPFYMFLGTNKVNDTIETLLESAITNKLEPQLKCIPEVNIADDPDVSSSFQVTVDRDNFDYIFLVDELCELEGKKFHPQRRRVHQFEREYPNFSISLLNLHDSYNHESILEIFLQWEELKGHTKEDTIHEFTAIKRLLKDINVFNYLALGIYNEGKLIAFSISELVQSNYAILHFTKADHRYLGIYQMLFMKTAQELAKNGKQFLNMEQDLGIPGLREMKEQWNPVTYLKKYIIGRLNTHY